MSLTCFDSEWEPGICVQTSFIPYLPIKSLFLRSTAKFRSAMIEVCEIVGEESVIFSTRIGSPFSLRKWARR